MSELERQYSNKEKNIHELFLLMSSFCDDINTLNEMVNGINSRIECVENVLKTEAIANTYRCLLEEVQKQQHSITDNARRLDTMMKELKGIIAMVRPSAAKNPWYQTDKELPGQIVPKTLEID